MGAHNGLSRPRPRSPNAWHLAWDINVTLQGDVEQCIAMFQRRDEYPWLEVSLSADPADDHGELQVRSSTQPIPPTNPMADLTRFLHDALELETGTSE